MQVQLTPAYLLHSRKYTDSRIIVEFLTEHFGVVSGVYRTKANKNLNNTIPSFKPLLVSWQGKNSLKTVTHVETSTNPHELRSVALFAGMYLNELLVRLLPKEDEVAEVYRAYTDSLSTLAGLTEGVDIGDLEQPLRNFELTFLAAMGYAVNFETDINGKTIENSSKATYYLVTEQGFQRVAVSPANAQCFTGDVLNAIANRDFTELDTQRAAKKICRKLLHPLLGGKPLKSRELFQQFGK